MNKTQNRIWLLITLLLAIAAITYELSYFVTHPASTMSSGGDAGKNNYTYLYHIVYEKGIWFTGMNYPYGEHIVFTDGQPFLSVPLSYLRTYFDITASNALAVMNLLIAFSYVLGIFFVYKILLYFRVRHWIASVFSVLIIIFSPQLFRLPGGHLGLTYVCIIPMLFYWIIQYHYSEGKKYPVYIFILGIAASLLHLYFMATVFIFIGFYMVGYFLFIRNEFKTKLKHIIPLIIALVCLFSVMKLFFVLTDPVKDRPTYPWGVLDYNTKAEQILTSAYSPVWKYINKTTFFHDLNDEGEGNVYIGLVVIIIVLVSFISGIRAIIKNKKNELVISEDTFSRIWLFVAFAALLLGMGVPFIWHMEWLLNYLSLIRQFRSLGRFSWIFYYIITVYAVVVLNSWYIDKIKNGKKIVANLVFSLAILLWATEAYGYIKMSREAAASGSYFYTYYFSKESQNWNDYLKEHRINKDDYQAILCLPFFNLGTDKISAGTDKSGWVMMLGGKASIQLHIPMVELWGARASWSQCFNQFRIVGGPFADKPLLKLVDNKPFLLLCFDEDSLDADSKYLLQASDYIGHYSQLHIYSCYPERIKENDRKNLEAILPIYKNMPPGDSCLYCKGDYFVEHFDNTGSAEKLFGNGAMAPNKEEDTILASFKLKPASDKQAYEFSAWVLLDKTDNRSPFFNLDIADSAGNIISSNFILSRMCTDNKGMWIRTSYSILLPANCRKIILHLINKPYPSFIALDEIMLRPVDGTIISKSTDGAGMANNHLIPANLK